MDGFRERTLIELMETLTSSLDLNEVLSRSYKVLSRMLVADYAAFCVSKPGRPTEYDWAVAKMPEAFFASYHELAGEDFVRLAVVKSPNKVLRDSEMLSRAELKRSKQYRHSRDLKKPFEYVIALLLDVRSDWHGGFTLYRESPRRPFSEVDQRFLQHLTPALASTVRNCQLMREVLERGKLLEDLYIHEGFESIVIVPPARELMRTRHATALVKRWFSPMELGRHGLPMDLWKQLSHLAFASQEGAIPTGLDTWERKGADRSLRVTFVRLPELEGRRPWALVMHEVPHGEGVPAPQEWQGLLTQQELKVAELALLGVDNQFIAQQLSISINTVKTHLKNIFAKLSVPNRSKLILDAQERNARSRKTQRLS